MNWIKDKYENFCFQWKRESFRKGFASLIGAIIINFFNGAIYSLCTLSVYEISYIKENGGSIEIEHLTFYYPIELLFQCISAFGSGTIYKKLGLHTTNLVGVTTLIIGYYTMYLSNNLYIDLLAMILGGVGTGIILYPSTTNAYEWFPLNNGVIVGIMETMISFGSFFWSFIGEKIINSEQRESREDTNLYDMDIAIRIKLYLIVQIIGLLIAYIVSYILMYERKRYNLDIQIDIKAEDGNLFAGRTEIKTDFDKDFMTDNDININENDDILGGVSSSNINKEEKIDGDDYFVEKYLTKQKIRKSKKRKNTPTQNRKKSEGDTSDIDKEKEILGELNLRGDNEESLITEEIEEKELSMKFLLKFTLKSKRLILFIVILILQAPVSNMAFSVYREIGEYYKIDIKYLQLVGSLYFIFECLSSFVFGVLCDYFSLKNLFLFINIVGTIVGFTYCLTFQNGLIFFLVQNFLSFSAGGYYPVKDCYLMKVFGKDIYIELSAFASFLVSIAINLITPVTYFVMSGYEDKETAYWILFVSFGAINLVGTILNFFLKETPIDKNEMYMEEEKEEKK